MDDMLDPGRDLIHIKGTRGDTILASKGVSLVSISFLGQWEKPAPFSALHGGTVLFSKCFKQVAHIK